MDFSKFLETGELSDICVVVDQQEFHLHKFPLFAKSNFFRSLARNKSSEAKDDKVILEDFPGGSDIFQLVANHCYNVSIDISETNVCALRCAAEYLQMSNTGADADKLNQPNLASVTDRYITDVITSARAKRQLSKITNLISNCRKLGEKAEQTLIVDRCISAVVDTWLLNYRYLRWNPSESKSIDIENLQRLYQFPLNWFVKLISLAQIRHVTNDVISIMIQIYIRLAIQSQQQGLSEGQGLNGSKGAAEIQKASSVQARRRAPAGQANDDEDDHSESIGSQESTPRLSDTDNTSSASRVPLTPLSDEELTQVLDALLPLIPHEPSCVTRSVAPQWLLEVLERTGTVSCDPSTEQVLTYLGAICLPKFSNSSIGKIKPDRFVEIVKEAVKNAREVRSKSDSEDEIDDEIDDDDDDDGENDDDVNDNNIDSESDRPNDNNDNIDHSNNNNKEAKNKVKSSPNIQISRLGFNRNALRIKKRGDTPGQSHSETDTTSENEQIEQKIAKEVKSKQTPENKKLITEKSAKNLYKVNKAAEIYLKALQADERLDVRVFRELAAVIPGGLRVNEDTLFNVVAEILKSDIQEAEKKAVIDSINLENLTEKSLSQALDSNLLPDSTVARAALSLCTKLRSELEYSKGFGLGPTKAGTGIGCGLGLPGQTVSRSWRPNSGLVRRVASLNSEADSSDSYDNDQADTAYIPRRVRFQTNSGTASINGTSNGSVVPRRHYPCWTGTGSANTGYPMSTHRGTEAGVAYYGTARPSVPTLASDLELRRALNSLQTAAEMEYPRARIWKWRGTGPAYSRPFPATDRQRATADLNRFYDDLEQALYLDTPGSRISNPARNIYRSDLNY